MSFAAPRWLWLLTVVGAAAAVYVLARRRPPRDAVMFTNVALLRTLVARVAWRRHLLAAGYLAIAATLVFTIARPQRESKVVTRGGPPVIMLAVDA